MTDVQHRKRGARLMVPQTFAAVAMLCASVGLQQVWFMMRTRQLSQCAVGGYRTFRVPNVSGWIGGKSNTISPRTQDPTRTEDVVDIQVVR